MQFHKNCGKSIEFSTDNKSAERKNGYCDGIVYSLKPLNVKSSTIFQVKIDSIEDKWAGSIVSFMICISFYVLFFPYKNCLINS